jgi:hypothetical protein
MWDRPSLQAIYVGQTLFAGYICGTDPLCRLYMWDRPSLKGPVRGSTVLPSKSGQAVCVSLCIKYWRSSTANCLLRTSPHARVSCDLEIS